MLVLEGETVQRYHRATAGGVETSGDRDQLQSGIRGQAFDATTRVPDFTRTTRTASADGNPGVSQAEAQQPEVAASTSGTPFQWQSQDSATSTHNTAFFDDNFAALNTVLQSGLPFDQGHGPIPPDGLDPFSEFDIPFWFEQDQEWDIFQDFK